VRQLVELEPQDLQFWSQGEQYPDSFLKYPACVLQSMQICLPAVENNPWVLFEQLVQLLLEKAQPEHDTSHGVQKVVVGSMNELL
jgi:hypothetical protein